MSTCIASRGGPSLVKAELATDPACLHRLPHNKAIPIVFLARACNLHDKPCINDLLSTSASSSIFPRHALACPPGCWVRLPGCCTHVPEGFAAVSCILHNSPRWRRRGAHTSVFPCIVIWLQPVHNTLPPSALLHFLSQADMSMVKR